jgi:hypothetical protein
VEGRHPDLRKRNALDEAQSWQFGAAGWDRLLRWGLHRDRDKPRRMYFHGRSGLEPTLLANKY